MQSRQPPVIVIKYDLTVKGLSYYVFLIIAMLNFDLIAILMLGVCPSYHSPNDMTPLSIDINAHDQETLIIS